jgi:hypothetical protein
MIRRFCIGIASFERISYRSPGLEASRCTDVITMLFRYKTAVATTTFNKPVTFGMNIIVVKYRDSVRKAGMIGMQPAEATRPYQVRPINPVPALMFAKVMACSEL